MADHDSQRNVEIRAAARKSEKTGRTCSVPEPGVNRPGVNAPDPHAAQGRERLNDPTRRDEATKTPEGRGGWDEPRHPEASEAMASRPPLRAGTDAIPDGVRAESRQRAGSGGNPGTAPVESDAASALYAQVKEAFSRYHRGDHDDVVLIEQDVMVALERAERRAATATPCFCGTPDAYRCPAHINPVQFSSGGR